MLKESKGKGKAYETNMKEVIRLIERRGYENVLASIEPYESPKLIESKSGGTGYVPDITAEKWGAKGYFEIANKDDAPQAIADKWLLLELLAKMKSGTFQIFAPRGTMNYTQRIVDDFNIQAEVVKI
jgi:hypothetical protein